jgi:hypothetical protein
MKRPATREKRLATLIDDSAAGRRIPMLRRTSDPAWGRVQPRRDPRSAAGAAWPRWQSSPSHGADRSRTQRPYTDEPETATEDAEAARALYLDRYIPSELLYFAEAAPRSRADLVIDTTDLTAPRTVHAR